MGYNYICAYRTKSHTNSACMCHTNQSSSSHNMLKFQKFSYCYSYSIVISNAKNVISDTSLRTNFMALMTILPGRNPLCQCHFRMFTNVLNVYVFLCFALGDLDGMSFAGALLPGFPLANFLAAKFSSILSLLLFTFFSNSNPR